jgi:hypothetical protein
MNARKLLQGSESEPAEDLTRPVFADHAPAEMREAMYEAWEKAISALEAGGSHYARPGVTFREVYRYTDAGGVYRRSPTPPPAALPEGAALKRAKDRAHTKMILARNAAEAAIAEYVALGGNPNDEAQHDD